jgi:hypothetical protein
MPKPQVEAMALGFRCRVNPATINGFPKIFEKNLRIFTSFDARTNKNRMLAMTRGEHLAHSIFFALTKMLRIVLFAWRRQNVLR